MESKNTSNWKLNIKVFIADSVLQWFYIPIGVWVLIWSKYLSFTEIGVIYSVGLLVSLLLELPTGAIADLLGRKKTIVIGRFIGVIGFFFFAIASNFWHFLIASICYHANWAFESGAMSALLYDSLKENGKEEEYYRKTESDTFFWCTVGMALASIIGGLLYKYNYRAPYIASFIVSISALIGSFFFDEPKLEIERFSIKRYIRQNINGLKHIFAAPLIRSISLFSIAIDFVAYTGLWYLYEPRLTAGGFPAAYLGLLVSGTYLIRAFGTKLIPQLIKRTSHGNIPLFLTLMQMIGSGLSYIEGKFGAISSVYTRKFSDGFRKPILTTIQNDQIDSKLRATALSAIALLSNLVISAAGFIIGPSIDKYGTEKTLGFFFWIGLIIVLPLGFNLRRVINNSSNKSNIS